MQQAKIVLVDDHALMRNALAEQLKGLDHQILFQADNGKEFIERLNPKLLPDIVLLDVQMPVMDGFETSLWLRKKYPDIKILILSMLDSEMVVIRMIKNGARGFMVKSAESSELKMAIDVILTKGVYHSELVSGKLYNAIRNMNEPHHPDIINLSDKEIEFLKLCCSEKPYKEIANIMGYSPRTIDSIRDALFEKLNIKSRIGLVLFAIKNGIVQI